MEAVQKGNFFIWVINMFHLRKRMEMTKIEAVKDNVSHLMELLIYLAHNDPEQMKPLVIEVSRCLSSMNFNSNNLLED